MWFNLLSPIVIICIPLTVVLIIVASWINKLRIHFEFKRALILLAAGIVIIIGIITSMPFVCDDF